jgi:lipopolysaccharide export system ATP-binding protein
MTTGQIQPNDGHVWFNGQDVTGLPMYKRARLGMGYLSQETSVFRSLSVEQNILAILEAMPACRSLGRTLTYRERHQRTAEMLEQFGLSKLRHNNAGRLSGGERRRLEIARCLVSEPLLILLDEPFTGIDPKTIGDIQQIVLDLRRQGIAILVTDHNVRETLKITDRSYLIKDGLVRTHGTPQQIVRDPIAIDEYLGKGFHDNGFLDEPPPAPVEKQPEQVVHLVLEQEKIHREIERLKTPEALEAAKELLHCGPEAVQALLDAMDRRDVELRRQAFAVLQRLVPGECAFDPYAPEALRKQQLAELRERLGPRKAG